MSQDRRSIVTEQWSAFYEATGIPAAVADGSYLHLTGHTGDRSDGSFDADPRMQIRQAFANVANSLAAAGAGWSDVVSIRTYHVGLQAQGEQLLETAAEFLGRPFPAWSAVGITELFEPDAIFEIECVAKLSP